MTDTTHLSALRVRLSHERAALARCTTKWEAAHRVVWISQIEKEISGELKFLAITEATPAVSVDALSDDELLKELGA